jgi:long-chain acyl-CoA synthetase
VNLAAIVEPHPADRPALVSGGQVTAYGELRDRVAAMRGGLAARGVEPGDRVAIVAANSWQFVAAYLAVLGVGAVAVPLNPASPPPELRRELTAVGARLVVTGPAGRVPVADAETDEAAVDADELLAAPGPAAAGGADGAAPPIVDRAPSDPAVLLFTSGTAGAPRAAVLTHGNLLANLEQVLSVPGRPEGPDDVALGVLPLFHVFGLNALLGTMLHVGATVVLVERFDAAEVLDVIARRGVTIVSGVPAMWLALASHPGVVAADVAGVRVAMSGAAPLDPDVRRLVADRLGLELHEGYGLTEASPVVATGMGAGAPAGSIGRPLPGVQVRLVDARGEDVLVGDPGEIWVRGPSVFGGYWEDPEGTAAALTPDGWLRTGDVAVVDDDGFLYLVDRAKDVVIVSGFNVFPAEVEDVLDAHPAVAEAAVVGVPDPRTGEAVRAFVVLAPGATAGEDELAAFCAERLARYKCPTGVTFVDEIPHGQAGKLLRRALR